MQQRIGLNLYWWRIYIPLSIGVETLRANVDDFIEVDIGKLKKDNKSPFHINLKVNYKPQVAVSIIVFSSLLIRTYEKPDYMS